MRIAGVEKLGFYPTPNQTLSLLPHFLKPTSGTLRLLDPCAGQGEALATLAASLRRPNNTVRTYGIEVADRRASIATGVLDHVLHADYQAVGASVEAFSLLLLNPPYDFEAGNAGVKKHRLEYTFLRNTLRRLMPGGVLIYLVPLAILAHENVARFLSTHFQHLDLFTLPAGEFEVFDQIILFGVRKAEPEPEPAVQQWLMQFSWTNLPIALDVAVTRTVEPYGVPASPVAEDKLIFRKLELSDAEVQALVAGHGVLTTRTWRHFVTPQDAGAFTPAMPLRTGHIAGLISSGQIGTIDLGGLLAKGRSVKLDLAYDRHGDLIPDPDAEGAPPVAKTRSHFQTRVYTLTPTGQHQEIASTADLQTFLEQYTAALAQVVERRYAPRYQQPTAEEWTKVSTLLPHKRLPGRAEAGLLPAQKHTVLAATRVAKSIGFVDVIGEMGSGKTGMGTATVELLNAYPALVLCPGHLVEKWQREVAEVVPGAMGVIVHSICQLQTAIEAYQPGQKLFVILSKERAKLGSGWRPAVVRRHAILRKAQADGTVVYRRVTFNACPACGAAVRDSAGAYLAQLPTNKRLFCTKCASPLFVYAGFRRWPLADYIRRKAKGFFAALLADEVHNFKGKATDQARSYGHLVGAVRYTINLTGTLFGGKSLDLFWLRYRVDPEVRRRFSFHDEDAWSAAYGRQEHTYATDDEADEDGRFSGARRHRVATKELPGISPAVFRLLLKSCLFLRIADLGWGLPPYDEQIGRLDMTELQTQQYEWMSEELLGFIRHRLRFGASAEERQEARALLSVWQQNALARPNSCFRTETVQWRPDPAQAHQPFSVTPPPDHKEATLARLVHINGDAVRNDQGVLTRLPMVLAPVASEDELLPKEAEMLRLCVQQHRRGRKVLLFVRQTGVRNIQPRLKQVLEGAGLRVAILPDTLEPAKRERWIDGRVADLDVLVVNPKKIETGLELVKFATILFFEPEYALTVVWQAMKRVYRLGQTQPVEIYFLVYHNTLESHALNLVGQKMGAALLLYGDNAASAIADEAEGDGDLLAELTHQLLAGAQLESDGITSLLKAALPVVDTTTPLSATPAPVPPTVDALPHPAPPLPVPAGMELQPVVTPTDDPTTHRLTWRSAPIEQPSTGGPATVTATLPTTADADPTYVHWTRMPPPRKPKRTGHNGETQLSFFELAG